jgi:ribosomal protein S27E
MTGKGLYQRCPDCGNTASGTEILRCDFCGQIYCKACELHARDYIRDGPECRQCNKYLITPLGDSYYRVLGRIA